MNNFSTLKLSIQTKINLAVISIFALVLIATLLHTANTERHLVTEVVEQQTKDAADAYFDSINTMMLTGTMANRELVRDKMKARPGITEARVMRTKAVMGVYGEGFDYEHPADELDRRALEGEQIIELSNDENGDRLLTVINPVTAQTDYRGTNCIVCHQVPEGTVLGAVRVSYSLRELDNRVGKNILSSAFLQIVIFGIGFTLIVYLLRKVVVRRLKGLRSVMEEIEKDSDLSRDLDCSTKNPDEISTLVFTFNAMLGKFRTSMQEVSSVTGQLIQAANNVEAVSEASLGEVLRQKNEIDSVATAMNEMSSTVQEVANNAVRTAEASQQANAEAANGAYVATEALGGITTLMGEMDSVSGVISRLDSESENIGTVLDVIKGISEQTNLLALNAAIEAARAGEAGRGFAVVADEVRTLASRTQESAEEIRSMIENLQGGAREAVRVMESATEMARKGEEQVEAAAESLGEIAGEVSNINNMNTQIATAAEEQTAVAEEVNRNINTIAASADNTAEGARQNASVSEELVNYSRQLESLVSRFKLQ